jgi:HSP20 family protein
LHNPVASSAIATFREQEHQSMTTETKEPQVQESQTAEQPTKSGLAYRPNVDILETENELTLVMDVPGVERDSLDIDFAEGMLTVQARVAQRYAANQRFLLREYGIGSYYRSFQVGEQINGIAAEYADGVLRIHLPKAEAAKPRKIAVNVAG